MKISYNWLRSLINIEQTPEEIAAILTGTGLETEGISSFESVKGGLAGLVVGHVTEHAKHPGADRLSLVKVDVGNGEPLTIVCGAPNVAANQKVIVATPGTTIFPTDGEPFTISASKIRGELSQGMICAADEIGIGTDHSGIVVLPDHISAGTRVSEYYGIENDRVFEIGLTPNRGDAASHLGVARDIAAFLNTVDTAQKYTITLPGLQDLTETGGEKIKIDIQDPEACMRYSGIVISGITVGESPAWLKNRLRSVGVRPLNNIVDVTNFAMLELGQPMHAFDFDKIKGNQVIIRNAKEGQKFTTLDAVERTLSSSDLLICSQHEPMCIAGVLGGIDSAVGPDTKSVFLESACFNPSVIRKTSVNLGIRTEASFRFERGTDPDMTMTALIRATNLVVGIAGGFPAMQPLDIYPEKLNPHRVAFSFRNCMDLIGKEMDRHLIRDIIVNLGMEIESEGSDGLLLNVPRFRTDVTREADVIEEVMRIYGYDNVEPARHISYTAGHPDEKDTTIFHDMIASTIGGFGFSEIMGLSMTNASFDEGNPAQVMLVNPLSADLAAMRSDMLFGGLQAVSYNINRKNKDLKLFEIGKTYHKNVKGEYIENLHITLFVTGQMFGENPYGLDHRADTGFLSPVIISLFEKCGIKNFKTDETGRANFKNAIAFESDRKMIAIAGEVSQTVLDRFGIEQPVYYAQLDSGCLLGSFLNKKIVFEEIPRFPEVRRDLALLIDQSVKYSALESLAFATEKQFLTKVNLFDIYEDARLGGKKSYALRFTLLNKEGTLTDKQVDLVMEKLVKVYKEKLGAGLR